MSRNSKVLSVLRRSIAHHLPHLAQGPHELSPHGAFALAENGRNLFVRLVAEIAEHNHLSLLLGQGCQCLLDEAPNLYGVGLGLGLAFVGDIELYPWERALGGAPKVAHFVSRDG